LDRVAETTRRHVAVDTREQLGWTEGLRPAEYEEQHYDSTRGHDDPVAA
jgi:hypothetical protein